MAYIEDAGAKGSVGPDPEAVSNEDKPFHDEDAAKRLRRKIDFRMIPLLFVTYNLNFMDKTILSSAWVSSVFYFGYLFWEYPTSYLIQKLSVGRYMGYNTLFWAIVVALTAACSNYGGLITIRFLLGVAEATISPAFAYITAMRYTRTEIPTRTGIWFAGNSLGGVFASFLAYGIGHIEHSLAPWKWLYIVLGVTAFLWGFFLLAYLPGSISTARFLTPLEREMAQWRVVVAGTGKTRQQYQFAQFVECLLNPKSWFFFAISLLTQIPSEGTQNFGNLALKGFGFSSLETTLVTLPASFISFFTILGTGWLAGRQPNMTTYLICVVVIFPVIGSAIIYTGASKGMKLFAYYVHVVHWTRRHPFTSRTCCHKL